MIAELETLVLSTTHALYNAWGWLGVALLLIFENATGITPSEIILGLAGWMLIADNGVHPSLILVGGLISAAGSVIGASIPYWVARKGGRPVVDKLVRWLRISPDHITNAENQFQRWGSGIVLIGRMMPGVRTLINIPAGLANMPFARFLAATFAGAFLWCTLLIGAGYLLGHEWELVSFYLKQYFPYLLAGGGVLLALYVGYTQRKRLTVFIQNKNE
ncbi:MAG: DedA family protein [Anaerolineales bacterium]|jgi:membrane protein DedA with SNARE-associated domain